MMICMTDPMIANIDAARALLGEPMPTSPVELTELLTRAQEYLTAALDETMARAALGGASLRSIASSAQVAPNTVPPRLARSAVLGSYAEGGRVSAEGLAVARADQRQQRDQDGAAGGPTFTFTPRRRTKP
jgi:hypothetical protein